MTSFADATHLCANGVTLDLHMQTALRPPKATDPVVLTRREFQLLEVLMRHRGQILSMEQLLLLAWGSGYFNRHVVSEYVRALRRKLGQTAILCRRGAGYWVPR